MILMGKIDPAAKPHQTTSQILVPMDTPGITLLRAMTAIGDADAPKGHAEILFTMPFSNVLLGDGIMGRVLRSVKHGSARDASHCMRCIGQMERSLSALCVRIDQRKPFGKKLSKDDTMIQDIARCRVEIEACRYLVRGAAANMDMNGNKDIHTRQLLSLMKAHVPITLQTIVDRCMQGFGAMGISQDTPVFGALVRWARRNAPSHSRETRAQ